MRLQPAMERAVRAAQFLDPPCIGDDRRDLLPVAHDAGIAEQAGDIGIVKGGDPVDREIGKGGAQRGALPQHRQPRQPSLVDFERQPLEQHRLVGGREAVFLVVVWPVQRMPRRGEAVGGAHRLQSTVAIVANR